MIYVERNGKWIPKDQAEPLHISTAAGYYVMDDLKPYKSMVDGRIITSRSEHRRHLKAAGCIEVGNEDPHKHVKKKWNMPPVSESIKQAIEEIKSR